MDIINKNKGLVLGSLLLVLFLVVYNLFLRPLSFFSAGNPATPSIGPELVKMSQELSAVTLDRTLFSSPGFLLLSDMSVEVSPQVVGRPNPFNIIGRD